MTYSELLHQVSFDEIAPYIRKYGSEGCSLVWYKIHYDMLRQLEPHLDDDDEETATISNAELYYDWEEPHLDAYPMEGNSWESSLAKELIVNEDVNATWAEIAACCLWHTSYYGFTQAQRKETNERLYYYGNNLLDYDITKIRAKRAKEIVESKGFHVPSVKEMLKVPAFKNEIRKRIDKVRNLHYHMSHRHNWRRIKRKVIHNQYWERVLDLCDVIKDCIIENEHFFSNIARTGMFFNIDGNHEKILQALYANHIETYQYETYTDEKSNRAKWLKELIQKYGAFKRGLYSNIIICFSISSRHEITKREINTIGTILNSFENCKIVSWGINYDENIGNKMRMTVISYE